MVSLFYFVVKFLAELRSFVGLHWLLTLVHYIFINFTYAGNINVLWTDCFYVLS